jgi:hypothetical protein
LSTDGETEQTSDGERHRSAPARLAVRLRRRFGELRSAVRRHPETTALAVAAVALSAYVIAGPLGASAYPMMTDMPFHTAQAAVLRHYLDPAWHFREQFTLQPFAVPYLSSYLIAAALMTVLPAVTAMKVAIFVMLGLLPAGLAVLCWGMRKAPLLGLTGLGFVWCGLTSWGFVNFVGALGLFAMAVGLSLRLLDRPSRRLQWLLAIALVALFFTHVFRFPFAVAAVVGSAVVTYPATKRWRPIVAPLVAPLGLFAIWWWVRPSAIASDFGPMSMDWSRLDRAGTFLFGSLRDPAETDGAAFAGAMLAAVAAITLGVAIVQGRLSHGDRRRWAWTIGATLVPLCSAAIFLWLYLSLPMQIGIWWYVFPREITAASFVALGALPDLPRQRWFRGAFILAVAVAVVPMSRLVSSHWRAFHDSTRDFDAIVTHIPQAPKLLYLVFDHTGTRAVHTPFIHLPAYVQADRGGWLSFHFATWGASPVVYRSPDEPDAVIPPATPLRWEWTPQRFRVEQHGPFFDWFLVRRRTAPDRLFRRDTTIERVAHEGTWWLYRRAAD